MVFHPRRKPRLARLGDWMAANRRAILGMQWAIVLFYAFLVVLPAFLPHPHPEARLFSGDFGASSFIDGDICAPDGTPLPPQDKPPYSAQWHERLVLLAQYLFWGVWWPFVILSIMFMGRVWCGVLCPEGALAEFASRHGRGDHPEVAALGRLALPRLRPDHALRPARQRLRIPAGGAADPRRLDRRRRRRRLAVWQGQARLVPLPLPGLRRLRLLARIAPVHFRIDRAAWDAHAGRRSRRRLRAAARRQAHDQRRPVPRLRPLQRPPRRRRTLGALAQRRGAGWKNAAHQRSPAAAVFGMLGVAIGAFQWTVSPWFVALRQRAAEWLVEREVFWPLDQRAVVAAHATTRKAANDVFTWLDGAADPRLDRRRGAGARAAFVLAGLTPCRAAGQDRLARGSPSGADRRWPASASSSACR
jgi:hypothetical protein